MTMYSVRGVRVIEETLNVFADSPQEAAKQFREMCPGFRVELLTDEYYQEWESFSRCEVCSKELFIGDNYYTDPEGIEFCEECNEKAKESTREDS